MPEETDNVPAKLYIWNQPYSVNYGGSFLIVIAPDLETAKARAKNAPIYQYGAYNHNGQRLGETELGEPTRIIDKFPYAECYEWSE